MPISPLVDARKLYALDAMKPQDYLDEVIARAGHEIPGFSQAWEPKAVMHELVRLRLEQGLTQEDVASRMHVARPRIAEMEKRPDSVSFKRIVAYTKAVGGKMIIVPEGESSEKKAS